MNIFGNNIIINNGTVIVDGKIQNEVNEKRIEVSVLCNVDKIISEDSINIKGNVVGNIEAKTSVSCNDVKGNVTAGTSVNCDEITGDVRAGTSINCDVIKGNVIANIINK